MTLSFVNFRAFAFAYFCERFGAKIKPVKVKNVTEAVTGDQNDVFDFIHACFFIYILRTGEFIYL